VQAAAAITRARGILKIAANLPVILSSSNAVKGEVYGGGDAGRQWTAAQSRNLLSLERSRSAGI